MEYLTKLLAFSLFGFLCVSSSFQLEFYNPIADDGINPFAFQWNSKYYLVQTNITDPTHVTLIIRESPILTDFRNASTKDLFRLPSAGYGLSGGYLLEIDGELYIYFTLWGYFPRFRSNYVIKANGSDPMGGWGNEVKIDTQPEGTVMKHGGKLYYVTATGRLQIAEMTSPTNVTNDFVNLREPREEWECYGANQCINGFPSFLYKDDMTYLIYTGSRTVNTSLGQLSIQADKDPMVPANWEFLDEPVFRADEEEEVFSPSSTSFVDSPDKTETWMVYSASFHPDNNSTDRTPRLERIEWNEDGSPKFPKAHGFNSPQPVPSGQTV